jgi:hypothetical protein
MNDANFCLIHFHIPRTGGTTLRHLLLPALLERVSRDAIYLIDTGPEYGARSGSFQEFEALSARDRGRIRFVSGHVPLRIADLVPAPLMFTVVRDPVERALSDYWHCFHAADNSAHAMARRLSVAAFVAGGFGQAKNGHARYLSNIAFSGEQIDDDQLFARAMSGLQRMCYVGRYENLKETATTICDIAGLPRNAQLPHLQRAPRLAEVSPSDLQRIADGNRVDTALVARLTGALRASGRRPWTAPANPLRRSRAIASTALVTSSGR